MKFEKGKKYKRLQYLPNCGASKVVTTGNIYECIESSDTNFHCINDDGNKWNSSCIEYFEEYKLKFEVGKRYKRVPSEDYPTQSWVTKGKEYIMTYVGYSKMKFIDDNGKENTTYKKDYLEEVPEKSSRYKGRLKGFPEEVVEMMLDEQVKQGFKRDVTVFERSPGAEHNGFEWEKSDQGHTFWSSVIIDKKFYVFFEKYPRETKSSTVDINNLVDGEVYYMETYDNVIFKNKSYKGSSIQSYEYLWVNADIICKYGSWARDKITLIRLATKEERLRLHPSTKVDNIVDSLNSLPKYWIVDVTEDEDYVIVYGYLKNKYPKMRWANKHSNYRYFGQDGADREGALDKFNFLEGFKNNPVLLSIEDFKRLTGCGVEVNRVIKQQPLTSLEAFRGNFSREYIEGIDTCKKKSVGLPLIPVKSRRNK